MNVAIRRPALLAVVAIALGSVVAHAWAQDRPPAGEARFTILQLNDVYKVEGIEHMQVGGLGRVRALRRALEAEGRPVLVLHAGDLLAPSVMGKYLRSAPMIRCLNLLDGDAAAFDPLLVVTPGNHEMDDRDPGLLLGRLAQSDFPWVTTNVLYKTSKDAPGHPLSERLKNVHDTLVVDVGGTRVGLVGVTCDAQPRDYVEYGYDHDALDGTIRSALDDLGRQGARVKIAVTHQEVGEDVRVAGAFPELALVCGGHEHLYHQQKVGDTWITKGDADARSVVVLDVRVPAQGPAEVTPRRVFLGPDVVPDPVVEGEAKAALAELAKVVKERTGRNLGDTVATTEEALEGVEPAVRGRETALGNLLADVIRERMKTELAFLNGGAIRINDDVPARSPLTVYDLEGVFYFDNDLVAFELTGAELLELLRRSVSAVHLGHGRFLQVSGIRFRYRVSGPAEAPVYRIDPEDVKVQLPGADEPVPLEPGRTYSCASLDYVWQNGYRDGYGLFSAGRGKSSPKRLERPRTSWRKATEEWLEALPEHRVRTRIEGRIVRLEEK